LVREILHFRGPINEFVPEAVVNYIKKQQEDTNV